MQSIKHIVEIGRKDIQFAVVGDGPALEEVRALAQNFCISDFVTFTGRVGDPTLFSILSTSDVS